ncbi:hypothetical protein [Rubrobacter indicoceani]|uniref:hypothetical protein n=1 Tax=Rubrobacter indicoceani TaxID=2051957 RepID=UPI0013C49EB7|nr:hypothetical protein [Rubrobacter indicoceani]
MNGASDNANTTTVAQRWVGSFLTPPIHPRVSTPVVPDARLLVRLVVITGANRDGAIRFA